MKRRFGPLLALLSFVSSVPAIAQVVQVANTGCPNAGYPTTSPAARIGQPFTIQWPCRPPPISMAIFGLPSGGGLVFDQPTTCVPGPCRFYVAPPYVAFPVLGLGQWAFQIPNDRSLVMTTWAIQTGCVSPQPLCFTLAGAITLAIQP